MPKNYLIGFCCLICECVFAAELSPFRSDGCSVFPDGTRAEQQLWRRCCITHDVAYWKGGTVSERRSADDALQSCVSKLGEPSVGLVMLLGVRVGGSPFWPTPFRWGYGWPYPRAYGPLTETEQQQVEATLQLASFQVDSLDDPFWFAF